MGLSLKLGTKGGATAKWTAEPEATGSPPTSNPMITRRRVPGSKFTLRMIANAFPSDFSRGLTPGVTAGPDGNASALSLNGTAGPKGTRLGTWEVDSSAPPRIE